MVRHIVMFKLTEFATPAEKTAKMQEIKSKLEALIHKIDVLRLIRVDFNINPADHPEHVAVSKGIIGPIKADRACVDYEF